MVRRTYAIAMALCFVATFWVAADNTVSDRAALRLQGVVHPTTDISIQSQQVVGHDGSIERFAHVAVGTNMRQGCTVSVEVVGADGVSMGQPVVTSLNATDRTGVTHSIACNGDSSLIVVGVTAR
jgi:hypothetical protein